MAKALMRKDLTGKKFGLLTVRCVDEERTGNRKVFWICDCECGNTVSVQSTSLTRENGTKSCGCLKHRKGIVTNNTKIDMVGKKFGRLTVVKEVEHKKVGNRYKRQFSCDCDCGNKGILIIGESLRSGITTSCGCVYRETRGTMTKSYNEYDLDTYTYGVGYCQNGNKFFFDKEDYDKIKNYCWNYDGRYVQAHSLDGDKYSTAIIRLHRVILDICDREDINVDHINGVGYDCRKSNLRRATDEENARNTTRHYATIENPTGIYKSGEKYKVYILYDTFGNFNTFEEAFDFRKEKERELYGEFQWNPNAQKIVEERI